MHLNGIAGNDSCFGTFDPVFVELRGTILGTVLLSMVDTVKTFRSEEWI